MIQYILAGILLIWASVYIIKSISNQFRKEKGCASNCKCGVDFDQLNKSTQQ